MASLKEIRTRISSVSTTRQVTSAMKMVSAAKLRKAQNAVSQMRPYADKLNELLINISSAMDSDTENVFADQRDEKNILIVAVCSDRGLCGAFNTNVVKTTEKLISEKYSQQFNKGKVTILGVGRKASELLKSRGYKVITPKYNIFDNLTFENVKNLTESIMDDFISEKYDKVEIIYNLFKNAAVQILTKQQFLPISIEQNTEVSFTTNYIYEPSKDVIIKELIPKSLKNQFFNIILDSFASEHGARMTSMHMATENATKLIKELKISYNKARQETITNEILDIVGGANALA